jgi:hypothetical protein
MEKWIEIKMRMLINLNLGSDIFCSEYRNRGIIRTEKV